MLEFAATKVYNVSQKVCIIVRWSRKELNERDERTESGRELRIDGAAARKKREPKMTLVR